MTKLPVKYPKCRHCGRKWIAPLGVNSTSSYCAKCRADRKKAAKLRFNLRPLRADDFAGRYLLPRRFRRS